MKRKSFHDLIENRWSLGRFVCIGLDSSPERIPEHITARCSRIGTRITSFNREIVKATHDLVCAYKPNSAYYEEHGAEGFKALRQTIYDIRKYAPDVPIILDAKRGDIAETNERYARSAFDNLGADAITVQPYLGGESLKPFFDRFDKGVFVLCRTSNEGAGEFQDLPRGSNGQKTAQSDQQGDKLNGEKPLYQRVAYDVAEHWNATGNCGVVVGATYPEELRAVREIVRDMPILIPGIGEQGGVVDQAVHMGRNSHNAGMIINLSRGIIFASAGSDFAEAARRETQKLHDRVHQSL